PVLASEADPGEEGEQHQRGVVGHERARQREDAVDRDRPLEQPLTAQPVAQEAEDDAADGDREELDGQDPPGLERVHVELLADRYDEERQQRDLVVVEYPSGERAQPGHQVRPADAIGFTQGGHALPLVLLVLWSRFWRLDVFRYRRAVI